ncbi:hypothetical protein Goshw_009373 [Gossypium schwendimanii]|uniref:Uncharacterized protein n=1 Tax=Gossypium schwendimanii TaxID=34291 RepID=A0A7J9L1Z3_GOSSC|nr:hypothetical protein [Gossypium schwendimanii]
MGAVVHGKVHVEYQKELFMLKQVSTIPLLQLQMYGSGNLLVLRRHLSIQGYNKGDPFCCSNRNEKCYSSSSKLRYATSRSYDKGSWS